MENQYTFYKLPIKNLRSVFIGDLHIATVEYDDKHIYGLTIDKDKRRKGHGRAIATMLLKDGRKPVNIKPTARRFWNKVMN